MNKQELKKVLKPLIKECIREVIFEEGALSSVVSEVVKGMGQQIVETKQDFRQNRSHNMKQMNKQKQDLIKEKTYDECYRY